MDNELRKGGKNCLKGVIIGDIHFGIKDSKRLYEELSQFKEFILGKDDLQIVVINGDFFDRKLSIGDPESFYAISFFAELVKIVKEKKLIFRMIQGTKSHDLNQLQLFKHYENDLDMDFRIIETVRTEDISGLNVLYLPEEYPENSDEYYKDYKTGEYNIILGHGTWDFVAQPGVIEHSKLETHSAPVFMWSEWKKSVENGFIVFGHIHGRNTYGKKIFYPGSFTRWNYGERSEKGFVYFEYDLENKEYNVEYINNTMAPKYDVISVGELSLDLENTSVDLIKEALDATLNGTDNLRIDLSGLSKDKIDILRKHYSDNSSVKLEVREKKTLLKESAESKSEEFKKWHYITKRQLPLDATIQKYCKEELGVDLTLEVIGGIISE